MNQSLLPGMDTLHRSVALLPDIDENAIDHGEVFTRRWVVDLILDLSGYTSDRDLALMVAVEPACGHGAFLGPMVERLARSLAIHDRSLSEAADAIRAYDLLARNVDASRALVATILTNAGHDTDEANRFAEKVANQNDYLLRGFERETVDFVLGNPPYIRLEDVPEARSDAYRAACPTMGGRSDIYVGFIQTGLESLRQDGTLGFIVADRWMHNSYGSRLRRLVTDRYSVDVTIDMHDVDAFQESVSAYPAISVIRHRSQGRSTLVNTTKAFGAKDAAAVVKWVGNERRQPVKTDALEIAELPGWFTGDSLWPSGSPAKIALMDYLNEHFEPLQDLRTATRVSIGVATGNDNLYVTKDPNVVESERLLPLSMAWDTNSGTLEWSGHYLVNPWDGDKLVTLDDWPRLYAYLRSHEAGIRKRTIAKKNDRYWYRTIDKVTQSLTAREKLLFPDLRMTSRPVYDPGGLYPHHNLYYVVSEVWDLKVLGGLLFSRVAEATIEAYCVKMRGGTLRFQAQYLRQVRVPRPESISNGDAKALADAFEARDAQLATEAALRVYRLDDVPD